ncbi:MAG: LacI family DNA-binding transcriptional regulator [Bacteroidota bacterium]
MPPTIYDIAKKARVGIGTVSRVFNNHPNVSHDTKIRVLHIAKRMNYHPHPYARGLASNRTNSVLAIIPYFTTFFFVEILQAVQATLAESECDLILHGVTNPDHAEGTLKKNTIRGRVDGMLIFSLKVPDKFARDYVNSDVPIVLVDTYHPDFDSFTVENVRGAAIATDHLISLGHRHIGILNANLESPPARERLKGFKQALRKADIPVEPRLIKHSKSSHLDGFTHEDGYNLMKQFLSLGIHRPTAVFVTSDIQASGALQAMDEEGVRCPEDIALVGFDDIELARHIGLTTMRQPMSEMGSLAVHRLFERMKQKNLEPIFKTFVPTLVVRRTSGPINSV